MVCFNVGQGLVSEGRKMTLAMMWRMGLRGPRVHTAGLVRGLCPCGILGCPPKPEAAYMERRG